MRLRRRDLQPGDFERCWPLVANPQAYSLGSVSLILPIWDSLLDGEAMVSAAVEDLDREYKKQIVAFGAAVFVKDDYVADILVDAVPYGPARLIFSHGKKNCPILNRKQIADANSTCGLNVVITQTGWGRTALTESEDFIVRQELMQALLFALKGFNLRQIINEVYGDIELHWVSHGGNFHKRTGYDEYYSQTGEQPPANRPYLVGVTKEEARSAVGSFTSAMFSFTPPRLAFTSSQRTLLVLAMNELRDDVLEKKLGLSESALKSRWRSVYKRVENDAFLRTGFLKLESGLTGRSTSRRRMLLDYLREHMEELRPYKKRT